MYSDLRYLTVDLPEDILKLKWFGDFERALKVIDLRLKKEIPEALRRRLELEKEVLKRLPETYTYTREAALEVLKDNIADFEECELEELRDEDALDWIYVYGKVMFKDNFLSNLIKTRKAYADRVICKDLLADSQANSELLVETMHTMKQNGGLAYRMRIKTSLTLQKEIPGSSSIDGQPGETADRICRVHLPLPVETSQVHNFRLISTYPEPSVCSPADYPQRTVCFEAKRYSETAQIEDQEFSAVYEFENHMTYVELRADMVLDAQPAFYTEEQQPHICFTPYIRELVQEVVAGECNPLLKARRIYDFITKKVMYSFVRPYTAITDIPGYTASGLKGDCGLQALLFITMCRYARVPARWQAGLYCTPLEIGSHDWAQFYVAPYGWLYADCSFGGSAYRAGNMERWDFYFGNLDPFRVPAATEFQHEFMPPKHFMRNDPYDNQTGEAEYEDEGLLSRDYESKQQVLLIEQIEIQEEKR